MTQQRYRGGCQCGAVTYETEADLETVISCNCSRCKPMGFLLAFTPQEHFRLLSGEENLTEFRFNTNAIQHVFCRTCGVQSFAYGEMPDGTQMAAINVNCLDGVDARDLNVQRVDGASL